MASKLSDVPHYPVWRIAPVDATDLDIFLTYQHAGTLDGAIDAARGLALLTERRFRVELDPNHSRHPETRRRFYEEALFRGISAIGMGI